MKTFKPTMLIKPLLEAGLSVSYLDMDDTRCEKVSRIAVNGTKATVVNPHELTMVTDLLVDVIVIVNPEECFADKTCAEFAKLNLQFILVHTKQGKNRMESPT